MPTLLLPSPLPSRSMKAKSEMRKAAQQAGLMYGAADAASQRDQAGKGLAAADSHVVLLHEQEAAALTACLDPVHAPHLKVGSGDLSAGVLAWAIAARRR